MPKPKDKAPRVVYVEWEDSSSTRGWVSFNKEHDRPEIIKSIGFLVHGDKDSITVTSSQDSQTETKIIDPLSIPRSAIRKVREIPLAKKRG